MGQRFTMDQEANNLRFLELAIVIAALQDMGPSQMSAHRSVTRNRHLKVMFGVFVEEWERDRGD